MSDIKYIIKAFSPRIAVKALTLLDKSTAVVVGSVWAAALVISVLAVIAVHSAASARKEAAEAIVAEPVLPIETKNNISPHEAQELVDRLQQQFPDIKFDIENGQAIIVKSNEGSKFHQWVTAVSYVDAMSPEYHWAIRNLCVGHCERDLMTAALIGQRVEYTPPPKN